MAPRKPARARSRRAPATPKTAGTPIRQEVIIGSFVDIPDVVRQQMFKELLALGDGRVTPPSAAMNTVRATDQVETRSAALVRRLTELLDDLSSANDGIEKAAQRLGGSWPWPEPTTGKTDAPIPDANNFHDSIELRLDRLRNIVRHAQILRDRLGEIV